MAKDSHQNLTQDTQTPLLAVAHKPHILQIYFLHRNIPECLLSGLYTGELHPVYGLRLLLPGEQIGCVAILIACGDCLHKSASGNDITFISTMSSRNDLHFHKRG